MGDRKGQEKRNLEEIQDKQLDGAWPRAAPFGIFQHRYCHGLRSSGSSPCLLPALGTSLFLSRGVLRLSINLFSFEGLPHCCGVSRFLGNYRELWLSGCKGSQVIQPAFTFPVAEITFCFSSSPSSSGALRKGRNVLNLYLHNN